MQDEMSGNSTPDEQDAVPKHLISLLTLVPAGESSKPVVPMRRLIRGPRVFFFLEDGLVCRSS